MQIRNQGILKNGIFQVGYQFLMFVIPLVLSPYLTRTLGDTALGEYSYSFSIAYYFVLFGSLGIGKYGQRLVSVSSNDTQKLRKSFWSLFLLHIILSLLAIVFYVFFILVFAKEKPLLFFYLILYVGSALFDITWLFYGLENFKWVLLTNLFVKIAECTSVFLFVKSSADVAIYTLILSLGYLIGYLVLVPIAIITVKPIKILVEDIKPHLKPMLTLTIATVAVSLYTVFDKILLGMMTDKANVAYYEYSSKIIGIPKAFISIIGTVMYPRVCKTVAEGNFCLQKKYIEDSSFIMMIISVGSIFGLCGISNEFVRVYYGSDFQSCGIIVILMCPLIFIVELGDILRTQYLIPMKLDKQYSLCIVYNAIINLVLSIALIPFIGIYGALIGTISAEMFGLVYQIILSKKAFCLKYLVNESIPFFVFGLIMFLVIKIMNSLLESSIIGLCMKVFIGLIVYIVPSILYLKRIKPNLWSQLQSKITIKMEKNI